MPTRVPVRPRQRGQPGALRRSLLFRVLQPEFLTWLVRGRSGRAGEAATPEPSRDTGLVSQRSATHNWPGRHHGSRVKDVPGAILGGSPCDRRPHRARRRRRHGVLAVVVAQRVRQGPDPRALWRCAAAGRAAFGAATPCQGPGTVVGRERRTRRQNDRLVTYSDGRTVVFTSAIGSTSEPDPGRSLAIRYRLDDPEQAEVVSAATWVLGRL
jgi:hypothetical protein